MPLRAKRWFPADENERFKTFRYEHENDPDIWAENRFDKETEHYRCVRCTKKLTAGIPRLGPPCPW